MPMYVYHHNCTDFTTNGIAGDLMPITADYEEEKNGKISLKIQLIYDIYKKWKSCKPGNYIKCAVPVRVPPVIEEDGYTDSVKKGELSLESTPVYAWGNCIIASVPNTADVTIIGQLGTRKKAIFTWQQNGRQKQVTGYIDSTAVTEGTTVVIPQAINGLESTQEAIREKDQLFVIRTVSENINTVTVTCEHVFYELYDNYTTWNPTGETVTGADACRGIMDNLLYEDQRFHIYSNGTETVPASDLDYQRKNAVDSLLNPQNGVCTAFDLTMIRDNFDIYCVTGSGSDRGFVVEYSKNMLSVQRTEDTSNVITRVIPFGYDEEDNIVWLNTGSVDSPNIGNYAAPMIQVLDTHLKIGQDGVTSENIHEKMQVLAERRFLIDHADEPDITMTVDFLSMGDTEEYKQYRGLDKVYLGDIIAVHDTERDYNYSAQVIAVKYDAVAKRLSSIKIGSLKKWSGVRKVASWQIPEITGANIRYGSVQGSNIASNAIDWRHISEGAASQITTNSLIAAKAQIHDLIAGSITADDIATGSLTARVISSGAITSDKIDANAVTASKIAANAITSDKIEANAITSEKINAGAIVSAKIAANAITADKLDANAVTAEKIAANAIRASHISTTDVDAINARLGIADIARAEIGAADINYLQVKDLNAQSAYFGQAVIQEGLANKLFIPRLSVVYAQMVAATISDLVIQATNDQFYRLDVDMSGNVTATRVTPSAQEIEQGHTSDGRTIYLGTDIVAEDLNTTNIYASHALMDEITANIINVDQLFAREATISKINAMDLSSNTYIRSTIGTWSSGSTITQTINSLNSRISELGYGTVYMQPDEPDHSILSSGDIWICTLSDSTWQDIYDNFATWQEIYDDISTWQIIGGMPIMYVWDGIKFQLMYDSLLPTMVETEIQQLSDEIMLRATKVEMDELSHDVSEFSAQLTIQADEIEAAVSAVNTKASTYVMLTDPRSAYNVSLGDIWVKRDEYFQTWQTIYDHYNTWQEIYDAHDAWKDGLGDETYVWNGSVWVMTSDRASEIIYNTKFIQTDEQFSLIATQQARFQNDLTVLNAELTVTAQKIQAEVTRAQDAESGKIDKTTVYQTADAIVAAAEAYTDDNAYKIVSGIEIKAAGIEISGAKYIKIKSGGSFTVESNKFNIDTSGNVTIDGKVTSVSGSIGGWTLANNRLSSGSGSSYVGLDSGDTTYAIWAGNSTASSAPFRVSRAGAMTATSGSVGGWTLAANLLSSGSGSSYVGLSSNSSDTYAIWTGSASAGSAPFRVSRAGALTSTSGSIGGWSLSSSALTSGSGSSTVGLSSTDTYAIWAGSSTASSAPFCVTRTGAMTATAGSIGGWILSANSLISGSGSSNVGLSSTDTYAFWAGSSSSSSAPFRVSRAGAMTATSGSVGGWTMASNLLSSGSGSSYVGIDSGNNTYAIWAGSSTSSSAPFRVSRTGAMTATSGSVGGWTLASNLLSSGSGASYVGLSSNTSDTYAIWLGNSAAASAPFRVSRAGAMTATSGSIGGWTLSANSLVSGSGSSCVGLSSTDTYAFWAGSSSSSSAPFRVTRSGQLTASGVSITGTINATSLNVVTGSSSQTTKPVTTYLADEGFLDNQTGYKKVSGVNIDSNGLTISGKNIHIDSGGTFTVGSGNFNIDSSGNVSITGQIHAASGSTLGGWTLTNDSISSGTFILDSNPQHTYAIDVDSAFRVGRNGDCYINQLIIANEQGQEETVNLSSSSNNYPMWKLYYHAIKSYTANSITLTNGQTVNFNTAASVTLTGTWSGSGPASFTVSNSGNDRTSSTGLMTVSRLSSMGISSDNKVYAIVSAGGVQRFGGWVDAADVYTKGYTAGWNECLAACGIPSGGNVYTGRVRQLYDETYDTYVNAINPYVAHNVQPIS